MQNHFAILSNEQRIKLHYARSITPKYVTSGGAQLRSLAPRATQLPRNVATVASYWRHCTNLTDLGIEPRSPRTDNVRLTTELTGEQKSKISGQHNNKCLQFCLNARDMGPPYHIYAFSHEGPLQIFRKIAVAKLANKRLVAYQGPSSSSERRKNEP